VGTGIPAGLTPTAYSAADGRRFGLTVGAAFAVISAFLAWRGLPTGAWVTGVLGAVLIAAGLVLPRHLQRVEVQWMRLALAISKVTTPIIMGIIFFLVIFPIGLLMRALGHRPLQRPPGDSFWVKREQGRSDLRRQF
jgi:hypothetical protein